MSRHTAAPRGDLDERERPEPDDARKPDAPTDLTRPSWIFVLRKTAREFSKDQCTDLAAALTYYAVLALFPAVIALMSLVGLFGQGPKSVDTLLQICRMRGGSPWPTRCDRRSSGSPTLLEPDSPSSSGLAGALWSASGYVGAFGRAMNRMYEVGEGRPVWKLRPAMLLVTFVLVVLAAVALLGLVVTGPVARIRG